MFGDCGYFGVGCFECVVDGFVGGELVYNLVVVGGVMVEVFFVFVSYLVL